MKKFYAFAFAAMAALSMNATIYVVGSGDGINWDLPGKAITGEGKVYTFTINNLTQFKFSTNNSTEWDGDNSFNAGAYATGNTTFGADVAKEGGQTLAIEPWGENQALPWRGNYTITVDLNAMTMTAYTATPKPLGAPEVYIRGASMGDGWAAYPQWQFTNVSYNEATGAGVWTFECEGATEIAASVEFKFADADWGAINFGGVWGIVPDATFVNYLEYNTGNMTLGEDFAGIITLKVVEPKVAEAVFAPFEEDGVASVEADANAPVEYFNLQGVKVDNPENGVFIMRQGSTVAKVVK